MIEDITTSTIRDGKPFIENPGILSMQMKANWSDLRQENGLALLRNRLIIPSSLRRKIVRDLHTSHQGFSKTIQRARKSVYWPGITNDIKQIIEACEQCQLKKPSLPKEPYMSDAKPKRPFEEVSSDLFTTGGKHFLVYVCRYSGFPLLAQWNNAPTSQQLISVCRKFFSDLGIPNLFRSDGGTVYASQNFQTFLKDWNVTWCPSSPGYPQSNGYAEIYVKAMKHLISKMDVIDITSEQFQKALLEYRNTPRVNNYSPNEIVFGRNLRSFIPTHSDAFDTKWNKDEMDLKNSERDKKIREHYDLTAKPLPQLDPGQKIFVQNQTTKRWDKHAIVISTGSRSRSYKIKFPDGRILWRNRRFLRPAKEGREEREENNMEEDDMKEKDDLKKPKPILNLNRRSNRTRKPPIRFAC